MNKGIAINLTRASKQDSSATTFRDSQHIDRAKHGRFNRFDWVELVVSGCGWTCHMVDLIYLEEDGQSYIVTNQFEVRSGQQVRHVALLSCEKIVEANDVVAFVN